MTYTDKSIPQYSEIVNKKCAKSTQILHIFTILYEIVVTIQNRLNCDYLKSTPKQIPHIVLGIINLPCGHSREIVLLHYTKLGDQ